MSDFGQDIDAALRSYGNPPSSRVDRFGITLFYCLTRPGLQAVLLYRVARYFVRRRLPVIPSLIKIAAYYLTGAEIEVDAQIGPGLVLMHPNGIVIHGAVVAGRNLRLYSGVVIGNREGGGREGPPRIGDDVHIGTGAKVLGPIAVGDRAAIGANAVVISDVPADSRAVGIPAVATPLQKSADDSGTK